MPGGGYQYKVPTKGLIPGHGITYTLVFRVSTDPAGVSPGRELHAEVDRGARMARAPRLALGSPTSAGVIGAGLEWAQDPI